MGGGQGVGEGRMGPAPPGTGVEAPCRAEHAASLKCAKTPPPNPVRPPTTTPPLLLC